MKQSEGVRVGVIGCGYWGKNLVRNFHELGALAAVCDVNEVALEHVHRTYAVPTTTSVEQLLSIPDIQGVAIAAPAAEHYELAKKAMLSGKDVFVEKPLALELEEGAELVEISGRHSRVLMVGHLLLYHPAIVELRRMIDVGDFGRVEYISSSRLNLGKLRTEEDILWSFAPHDVAVLLHLLGETPTSVAAQGASYLNHPISDLTLTILEFKSGVKANIFVSWLHPFKEQKLVIVGSQKMAVFDDTRAEDKLVVYTHRIEWVSRTPVARRAEGQVVPIAKEEPLRLECAHFLECVRHRRRPLTDGENGLNVLNVLHAAGQSVRTHGQPVTLHASTARKFFVHPSAYVDHPCEIGEGTKIWHFTHVMADCKIGAGCSLGQNVNVASKVRIGNNVKIQNNVSLYTGVELEDDVFCGPSMVFTNVINPRSHVNRKAEYKRTVVRRGASLGANSTVVCGTTIGEFAFVGAGAVVTHDVPGHALVIGVPARQIGWVCDCGTRLRDSESLLSCAACGKQFVLQANGLAKAELKAIAAVTEVEEMLALGDSGSARPEPNPTVKRQAAYGD